MILKVYDNLVPKHLQDFYELSTLGQTDVNDECIHPLIDFRCKYESTAIEDGTAPLSLVHVLKSSFRTSEYLDNFALLPQLACDKNNLILHDIAAGRIFLSVPHKTKLSHYKPHTDFDVPHFVCLYYVNNADGPTAFYNEEGKIIKEVEPKKGRLVFFDGLITHSGGIPRSGPRCIVNFDIITKEK